MRLPYPPFLSTAILLSPLLLLPGCSGPYVPSAWRTQVPAATRAMVNPLPPSPLNIADGTQSYQLYCSGCHGAAGTGRKGRPALDTARVEGETDGEIYWILHNGSKGHGMPAWRSLGDQNLWQLVLYLRTLTPSQSAAHSGN